MTVKWGKLLYCILGIELIGNVGSLATLSQITTWYAGLTKPVFNPPNWLFGPVWTILFAFMGVVLYVILQEKNAAHRHKAINLFIIQLALNMLWSFVFFGWHQPGLAFAEIVVLWAAIFATILAIKPISKIAVWLLIPYLAWVTFAALLNFAVWRLN